MIVHIPDLSSVHLTEHGDFRKFKVQVDLPESQYPIVCEKFSGILLFADTRSAWVFIAALRDWPIIGNDPSWQDSLSEMIAKAGPQGWVDAKESMIRSHVQWRDADAADMAL